MKKFICRPFGDFIVDLNDSKTYEHLPQTKEELRQLMFSEIGYYYCYVNFWHKDRFEEQKEQVEKLIKNFTENEEQNCNNVLWYQEQIFLFQDEIENMC